MREREKSAIDKLLGVTALGFAATRVVFFPAPDEIDQAAAQQARQP
jgi:hypothetical protein